LVAFGCFASAADLDAKLLGEGEGIEFIPAGLLKIADDFERFRHVTAEAGEGFGSCLEGFEGAAFGGGASRHRSFLPGGTPEYYHGNPLSPSPP
jgi:hypothetical protein